MSSIVFQIMSRDEFMRVRVCLECERKNSRVPSDERHAEMITTLKASEDNVKNFTDKKKYHWMKKNQVLQCNGVDKLIDRASRKEVVDKSQLFDVIHEVHLEMGHAGRTKMLRECQRKYSNVGRSPVEVYLRTCRACETKKCRPQDKTVTRPLLTDDINRRAQIDLIDWTSEKSDGYGYILNYQDHLTKFVVLRPLRQKTAQEVAYHLLDIFCLMGAPNIIQVSNVNKYLYLSILYA